MANILKHIKLLYDQELYCNVIKVCDPMLTLSDQRPDHIPLPIKFEVTLYNANALYNTHQYSLAESNYQQALQMRKVITKSKNNMTENQVEMISDADIKYKIHLCLVALKQKKAAAEVLESVNPRQRTPKINMALGGIYKNTGMERTAIACFKEVLRECPMALDAIENLLMLGVSGVEVNSLVIDVSSDVSWLNTWIKAQALVQSQDYAKAIHVYKMMDTHGLLKDNTALLVNMAHCYHHMCEDNRAISLLQRALRINPNMTYGRDFLSTLLVISSNKEHKHTLENLVSKLESTLWSVEYWVVLGNLMLFLKRYDRAANFGQQAYIVDNGRNPEALLLKANALFHLKKYQEAIVFCMEGLQICPQRYDFHKCLVDCYIHSNRLREAEATAINACKQLNYSAQSYCLHASCLLKDPTFSAKAVRQILEKAWEQDKSGNTNATCMLVDLLFREQQYEQVRQLILTTLETQRPTSKIHQLLGDCYVKLQKDDEAYAHYSTALRLDPNNQRATEGLNSIGKNLNTSKRDQYYSCGDESCYGSRRTNSDQEGDGGSDNDLWPISVDSANFDD